jgi:signal transduction histidine kinase
MRFSPDDRVVRRYRTLSVLGAVFCVCLGLIVLVGWGLDNEFLKSILPGAGTMKPNTAVCMALLGMSLVLGIGSGRSVWRLPVAVACAIAGIAVASITLLEYLSRADIGIDRLLFPNGQEGAALSSGRMAQATALGFILLGISLVCLHANRAVAAQTIALPAGFLSVVAGIGYMFGARSLYQIGGFAAVAVHTVLGQSVLALAILLSSGDRGLMVRFSNRGPGGAVVRRLLAPTLLLLPLLGLANLAAQKAGRYDLELGTAILALTHILLFAALVLWIGRRVDHQEEERIAGQELLAKRSEQLTRSNSELEQFAYIASHDLQEPLRMIASYLELLERRYKGRLDDDADEFIGFAVDGAKRLQILIHDLLAYSKVGIQAPPPEMVNAEVVLDQAIQDMGISIHESNARVSHGPLPTVTGDRAQLGQVFRNLLGNALKFHSDLVPEVHVSASRDGEAWRFAVRDNGIGIEPQHFERAFRMFQRLHTREEYPGTGIGLAVCKKIVERHGGKMWVESNSGEGSRFFFTLPVAGGNGT